MNILKFVKPVFSICLLAFVASIANNPAALFAQETEKSVAAEDSKVKKLKVLLVTGGCCHDYDTQKRLIADGLEERGHFEVTVVQQGGTKTDSEIELYKDENWADGYDLVIHDECFANAKDKAWVQRILKPHKNGVPAMVIHCAMHCYRDGTDEWFKFCGVTSRTHGAHYGHEVLNRDAEHPIMKEFGAGWMNPMGELYWIERVWPTAHALASAKNREKGNEEVCVWTNVYGEKKTRVFGTTLGHHNETVAAPEFLDLLTRGALWACGKLESKAKTNPYLKKRVAKWVPKNLALGAPVEVSDEQQGNLKAYAVDGKMSTRWCGSGSQSGQTIQFEFGKTPKTYKGCQIHWEAPDSTYKYKIEISSDGKTWETIVDRSENTTQRKCIHNFEKKFRFAKVTYLGNSRGQWASMWEFELYGDEKVKVDPSAGRDDSEVLKDFSVPEGFETTLFATPPAVNYPVFVTTSPGGDVYVSVDKNGSLDRELKRGSVYRLRDLDGDGRADESKLFINDVDSPRGLTWDNDRLYVLHPPHLSAFIDKDGDGISDEQKVLVKNIAFGFKDRPADHTSNGVTLGIDGWLYLAIGDFGFMAAEGTDGTKLQFRGGGVIRVRPDGTDLQVYSRGTRNILEVAMSPLLNGFTRDNTNDGGGWDIRLHHFSGMEHHGYPTLYMNFGDEIIQPLADYGGGSGCGALYLDEPGFPAEYNDAAYTADWGKNVIFKHKFKPNGATFTPDQTQFFKGTRVTDLDVDAMSQIYVTSWKGATFKYVGDKVGYLVKVQPKNFTPKPLPNFKTASNTELVAIMFGDSHRRRLESQRELIRRLKNEDLKVAVVDHLVNQIKIRLVDSDQHLAGKVAGIFCLKQGLGSKSDKILTSLSAGDSKLRPFLIRALGDRGGISNAESIKTIVAGLGDENPRTRLESAVALARLQAKESASSIAPLLEDPDAVVRHTAINVLVALGSYKTAFQVLDETNSSSLKRAGAARVLQAIHQPAVIEGLISRVSQWQNPTKQFQGNTVLARLFFQDGVWKGNSWGTRPDTSGPYYQPAEWESSDKIRRHFESLIGADATSDTELIRYVDMFAKHKIQMEKLTDVLIEKSLKNENLTRAALLQISKSRRPSDQSKKFVQDILKSGTGSSAIQAQAVQLLIQKYPGNNTELVANALCQIQLIDPAAAKKAMEPFLRKQYLTRNMKWIGANLESELVGPLANASLLRLSKEKRLKPEMAEKVKTLMGKNQSSVVGMENMLAGIEWLGDRSFKQLVDQASTSKFDSVASKAKLIAARWRIGAGNSNLPRIKTMPSADALSAALKSKGNLAVGKALFESLTCNKCHTVSKDEPIRGPYMVNVANTYNRQQLIESILQPDKSIAQGFATNIFELVDGRSVSGFVIKEAADVVTIRDNEGNEIRILVDDIDARSKSTVSMMPKKLVDEISAEDLASLADYLESLRTKKQKAK